MPYHEEVEEFFMNFAREMREEGHWIMENYVNDWPGLLTKDQIRDAEVEEQGYSDASDDEH